MNDIVLKMPKTESDSITGINDGGIETYRNTPILSLTKEELQNSTDSCNSSTGKVEVEFNDFYINSRDLPDYNKVLEVYCDERKFWDDFLDKDKTAVNILDNAIDILKSEKIRCLRISDKNTTGLTGVDGESTPWKNLVKNFSVSDKPGAAGGSFGVGKNAAFACSELRMVFYNTKNIEGEEAFQGVVNLPSYRKDDNKYVGLGFFSKNTNDVNTDPIRESVSLDPSYKRTEEGMDKYIIGFRDDLKKDELKKRIITSSIDNFLVAFFNDTLCVKYGDTIIDKAHLDELFEAYQDDLNDLTKEYYRTIKNPEKTIFLSLFEENDIRIMLRMDPDTSRRAAIVRQTGMKVFDKANISGSIYFSAVVILEKDSANRYFKKLENPEHTQWADDRADNPADAKAKKDKIFNALREAVKSMHAENYEARIDADGVNQYLPYTYVTGKKNSVEGLSTQVETKKHAKKNKKPAKQIEDEITYEVDDFGNIIEDSISAKVPENNEGNGGEPQGEQSDSKIDIDGNVEQKFSSEKTGKFVSKRKLEDKSVKFALIESEDEYNLKFIVNENLQSGFVDISISGELNNVGANVLSAYVNNEIADSQKNKIAFKNIKKGEINEVRFKLSNPGSWALEVSINENSNK